MKITDLFRCTLLLATVLPVQLNAGPARSSADYSILAETIDSAGFNATSSNYTLRGSAAGEFGAGNQIPITSASYVARPGYAGQLSDVLTRAVSRLSHAAAGMFDVNLPLSGTSGVEPRGSSTYTLVFTFASSLTAVQSVSASASGPTQPGPSSGMIDPTDPHNYIVTLTGLPNAQRTTVILGNVSDSDANFASSLSATMGLLIGDANGDRFVNSADATVTRNLSGQTANATNFRADYNLDGAINSADATIARNNSGRAIPAADSILLKARLTQPFQVAPPPESFR